MKMPFNLWLKRIMRRGVHPSIADAALALVGEERAREWVASKDSNRLRSVVRRLERSVEACKRAKGMQLRVDTGELLHGPYGSGRVLQRGTVTRAVPVVVEDAEMHLCSLAFEVELSMPLGSVVHIVDSLPVFKGDA